MDFGWAIKILLSRIFDAKNIYFKALTIHQNFSVKNFDTWLLALGVASIMQLVIIWLLAKDYILSLIMSSNKLLSIYGQTPQYIVISYNCY